MQESSTGKNILGVKINTIRQKNGTALFDHTGSSNYYVFLCTFEGCKENGAIYIQRSNRICALVEQTVFDNCSSTFKNGGGSVLFICQEEGQFVQQRTCYYKSIADSAMAFGQAVKQSPSNKNYAIEVSVSECGENEEKGCLTCAILNGDIHFENNNITSNKCTLYSSVSIASANPGTCNFSTFRENNQTGSISLYFQTLNRLLNQLFSNCNVIGNKCRTDNEQVLFFCKGTTNVDNCIFLNNTAKYMFGQEADDSTLTISESYIGSNSTTGLGTVTFNNLRDNYDFNTFTHFYKENCLIDPKITTIDISYLSFQNCKNSISRIISIKKEINIYISINSNS